MFSYSFFIFEGKHINLLKLGSLITLLKRGTGTAALVLVNSRLVLGAVSKGRLSSRKINFLLRKQGFGA